MTIEVEIVLESFKHQDDEAREQYSVEGGDCGSCGPGHVLGGGSGMGGSSDHRACGGNGQELANSPPGNGCGIGSAGCHRCGLWLRGDLSRFNCIRSNVRWHRLASVWTRLALQSHTPVFRDRKSVV